MKYCPLNTFPNWSYVKHGITMSCLLILFGVSQHVDGQNLIFSGGHYHSVMRCSNGVVYSFGQGLEGQLGDNAATNSATPVQVVGLGGTGLLENIKQVDAGSGNFTLALSTCGDTVYSWGENIEGQLGDGTFTQRNAPIRVSGIGGTGFLQDIRFISGGNGEAFAITENDEILSWGGNDFGQLGRGTTTAGEVFPDYVLTGPGTRLTDVKFVDGGDDFGVALKNDGTVWFWGKDARGVGGQGTDIADPGATRTYAVQVRDASGTGFLQNITKITAGDRHIMALSSGDTLWSWGANWGRQVGNNNGNANQPLPTPVVNIDGNPGVLSGVRNIAGGNAHSVASLNDGTVVSWGLRRDGHLGDNLVLPNGGDGSPFPVYTLNPAGTAPLGGIINVSDGDNWSFAVDSLLNVYVWGRNDEGQLGLNDNTDRSLPEILTSLPCAITAPDEPPLANLGADLELCSPLNATLDANDSGAGYSYEWRLDGSIIPSETDQTLFTDTEGTYSVTITKTTIGCSGPIIETSTDEIDVVINVPTAVPGTYCPGGTANLGVTGSGEYKWYDAVSGGNVVGAGNAITTPVITGPGTVNFYVEDTAFFKTRVGPTTIPLVSGSNVRQWDAGDINRIYQIHFTTIGPLVIDSVTLGAYNGFDGDFAVEVTLVNATTGLDVMSAWTPVLTGTGDPTIHQVYIGLQVPAAGDYYLRYTNSTNGDDRLYQTGNAEYNTTDFPWTEPTGLIFITDNERRQVIDNDRYALFWDWVISYQKTCDRIAVEATELCPPCNDPGTINLTPSGSMAICNTTQVFTASASGTAPAGGFNFEFFFDDGLGGGFVSVQGPNTTNTITATTSGDYYVVVTDPSDPTGCTSTSATVSLTIDALPTTADAGSAETICATSTTLDGNTASVGSGMWSVVSGTANFDDNTDPTTDVTGLSIGNNVLRWTISNGTCPSLESDVTITVDETPSAPDAGVDSTICGSTLILYATNPTVGTGQWSVISAMGSVTDVMDPVSPVTGLSFGSNTLRWTVSNGVCTDLMDDVIITANESPTISDAGSNSTICSGSTSLAANMPAVGSGLWSVISGTGNFTSNSDPATAVNGLSTGDNVFRWTISNGVCIASASEVTITVEGTPSPAIAGNDESICTLNYILDATPTVSGSGQWSLINGSGSFTDNTSPTSEVTGLGIGINTFRWTVTNGSCAPETDDVIITVDENPSDAVAGDDSTICSTDITLYADVLTVGTGVWSVQSGTANFVDDSNPVTSITGLSIGNNTLRWTTSNGTCADKFDDIIISVDENPTVAEAGLDDTICEDFYDLNGNTPSIGTGRWSVVSGGTLVTAPNDPNTRAEGLDVGSNTLRWTVSNGVCTESTDDVIITVDETPTNATVGANQTLCSDNAVLSGNSPAIGDGVWTLLSGTATITTPNDPQSTLTGIATGTSVLRWTISNGVCASTNADLTIERTATAAADVSLNPSSPTVICEGDDINFVAIPVNGGVTPTFEWFLNGNSQGAASSNSSFDLIAPTNGDEVEVVMTSDLSCATGSPVTSPVAIAQVDLLPTLSNAGSNQNNCSNSASLEGNPALIGVGFWSVVSGNGAFVDVNDESTVVNNLDQGSNTLRWTISNGVCPESSSDVEIIATGSVTIADAGDDITICEGNTAQMGGNSIQSGETGTWSTSGDGSFLDVQDAQTIYSPGGSDITNGAVTLTWEIDNAVCPPTTDDLALFIDKFPSNSDAGKDSALCSDPLQLAATVPASGVGKWSILSGVGDLSDPNSASSLISNFTGTVELLWTVSNGVCPDNTDEVSITKLGTVAPSVTIDIPNTTICAGDIATFNAIPSNAGNAPDYSWTVNGVDQIVNSNVLVNSGLTDGDLVVVTLTSSLTCVSPSVVSSAPIEMEVVNAPISAITPVAVSICETESAQINTTASGNDGLFWLKDGVYQSDLDQSESITISEIHQAGQWQLIKDNGVCPADTSDPASVNVDQVPFVEAGTDMSIEEGELSTLNGESSVALVSWTPSGFLSDPTSLTPDFQSPDYGNYTLTLTAINGMCSSSDDMVVSVTRPFAIPNAFTPNNDGDHDIWELKGMEAFSDVWIKVYNRWGNIVFDEINPSEFWDGTFNGKPLPVATYYYIIYLNDGSSKAIEGNVSIIR